MARVEFGGDDGAIIAASFVEQMNILRGNINDGLLV